LRQASALRAVHRHASMKPRNQERDMPLPDGKY
jgi:hypothetical protein